MDQVRNIIAQAAGRRQERDCDPTTSAKLTDGGLLEMVYDPVRKISMFALWKDGHWELVEEYRFPDGRRVVPYSSTNNLIAHEVILFPLGPEEYGSDLELVATIQTFIHGYVDMSPLFERIAAYYVLLTWLFDSFNELPYLRVRGDPGTGKTRFLQTVGSLCYKPIFASGASTVSPLFRILDAIRGTLVIDESDFRVSDERAEVVKIFNNGNARGFSVLRSEASFGTKEYNPRAYHVFGPKLVATRGFFDDPALENRFLTEELGSRTLRQDVPISLPREHAAAAQRLRNRLLLFRFRNSEASRNLEGLVDRGLEPRLSQIFTPLLAVVGDVATRKDLQDLARSYSREMLADRSLGFEATILEVIRDLWSAAGKPPAIKELAIRLVDRQSGGQLPTTPKKIGWIVRRKLGLETQRSNGVYVIASWEKPRLNQLCVRYGLDADQTRNQSQDSVAPSGERPTVSTGEVSAGGVGSDSPSSPSGP